MKSLSSISLNFKTIILIFSIIFMLFIFFGCSAVPASAITDANGTVATGTYMSTEPVLGTAYLSITITGTSLYVGITNGNNQGARSTALTNISGDLGFYTFQNGDISASINVADQNSIRVNVATLDEPYFQVQDILCNK